LGVANAEGSEGKAHKAIRSSRRCCRAAATGTLLGDS
jgi:hypothetical protein